MKLSFAEAALGSLDALSGVDSACLFILEDERPLRGLAGLLDWRLCGGLSRILMEGRFVGASGDALLFPARGPVPVNRIFSFGVGRRSGLTSGAFALAVRHGCQALTRAGVKEVALQLPPLDGVEELERARTFLAEGATSFKGSRMILFGDARALAKAFSEAARSMKGLEVDREPLPVPGRAPSAPVSKVARAG
ncbi:MAG: peptidase M17 [Deltaproteobacteria bacterium]|nr:peptidase M17 [Deltaproteobacteria bacterium]